MEVRGWQLLYVLLLLVGASGIILVLDTGTQRRSQASREAFHKLVGGLGFGAALDLSGGAFGFDPRLDSSCSAPLGPIPGGGCFGSRHDGLLPNPPLHPGTEPGAHGEGHAAPH